MSLIHMVVIFIRGLDTTQVHIMRSSVHIHCVELSLQRIYTSQALGYILLIMPNSMTHTFHVSMIPFFSLTYHHLAQRKFLIQVTIAHNRANHVLYILHIMATILPLWFLKVLHFMTRLLDHRLLFSLLCSLHIPCKQDQSLVYLNLNIQHFLQEPKGYKLATKHPEWIRTIYEEIGALKSNNIWDLVP
ncbi:LOW QUALITY PROTEIN: hypothetical protein OSB04_016696 [Centaurea solstitialis]|uniref:Uncharacterized protein n=1 Tax=Centaurea solstitialis TaxID=347529 RepID=A0AA38WLB7_9ASTR|nr:LOW QUALITY PROTEIN: hypothetical protein OSB04_016696 [Centaurea solstitialis]